MKSVHYTTQFKKDLRKVIKRGKDKDKLVYVVDTIRHGTILPDKYRAHTLSGNWKGFRECHIEPDWLLIYDVTETEVLLAATGTHSDLFR